jgi:diguanylate cyclase (GGDEF)-like protein
MTTMRKQIWVLVALLVLEAMLSWANWNGAQELAQLQDNALQLHAQSLQAEGNGTVAQKGAAAAPARNEAARQIEEQGWSLIQQSQAVQRSARARQAWTLLVLAALLGIGLRSYVLGEREVTRRREAEAELRAEHASLENRIEQRTAELRTEVDVRSRAEERNRRQKRVLEMLANRAPLEEIFTELTASVAVQRRSWESAIHLVDTKNSSLQLIGSSQVSDRLEHYLRTIAVGFPDAPESKAWATGEPCFIGSMNQEHRPWSEFLFSNGIRSAWSLPLLRGDGIALGTLTIYSRLMGLPEDQDREVLDSAVRLASLVVDVQNMNRELHRKAYQDELTGVANRRAGEMRLHDAIARSRRQNESFAVMCIDVDRFKRINDIYGHACGDRVLLEVSKRISAHPVVKGALARMGGDEFLVLLESCTTDELACKTAGELVAAIAQPMELGCDITTVGASIGITMFPRDGDTPDELERHADAAMYQAKRRGIGWCAFSSAMRAEVTRATSIEEALREAIDPESGQGMLDVHYQPIHRANGELAGMEALLRFHHPKLGVISPAQFIPIAEETSLILPLGHWVLLQVCRQIGLWQVDGFPPLRIGVNISGIQWGREDFVEDIQAVLAESGAPADALTLELTESVMMQNANLAKRHMRKLKDIGVRFAMDDFGTGYSSFSYLHQLPIDVLKIDRSFIARLGQSDDSRAIVASIVSMAHMLGLITIAEGVETEAQRRLLTEMECDGMQGFLFAKPMSGSDATTLIRA